MKTIRSLMILAGLSLVVLVLGATGAKAQSLRSISFSGSFTLPVDAQWGPLTLPAGSYTLYYGSNDGPSLVEVRGTAKGSPHGFILTEAHNLASGTKNSLACVREGGALIVRGLELPAIGESAYFAMPHGARLIAHNGKRNGNTQLAEAPMLIQRIPVTRAAE